MRAMSFWRRVISRAASVWTVLRSLASFSARALESSPSAVSFSFSAVHFGEFGLEGDLAFGGLEGEFLGDEFALHFQLGDLGAHGVGGGDEALGLEFVFGGEGFLFLGFRLDRRVFHLGGGGDFGGGCAEWPHLWREARWSRARPRRAVRVVGSFMVWR